MNCYDHGRKYNRLQEYNYSLAGYYFVTLCTYKRVEFFGHIRNGQLDLNENGVLAHKFWEEIPFHYKNVGVDEFVIMPNHIHAIIILNDNVRVGTEQCSVLTRYGLLSKIIKSYKNIVTTHLRRSVGCYDFAWQRSFYDHIIRSEKALYIIRDYIQDNPQKWEYDMNNPLNFRNGDQNRVFFQGHNL